MPNLLDLTGQRYGRLIVLSRAPNIGRMTAWNCICDCEEVKVVLAVHLKRGKIISCGCYKKENSKKKATKHGHWGTNLHRVWLSLRQRCNNPKNKSYKNYGARGIKVCRDWDEFGVFETWALAHGYTQGLTIERVNNDGNYCPENCTWISRGDQNKNTRRTLNNRR